MQIRLAALILVALASGDVLAQERRPDKEAERRLFHSVPIKGTDGATRLRAYEQRQRMETNSPFGGLLWRNVGPEIQGGRIIDIVAPLGRPDQLYVAYATGGLYRTSDDGITWTSLFEDQSAFGIGSVAVTSDGKTLWVGSGEANSQRTSYSGTGVFKSTDEGKTWQHMGLEDSHHIGKVLIDPRNPNVVYVAALGHLYSQNPERGVYKTTDGGKTWKLALKVDEYTGAFDVEMDPRNPNVLLATMWDRDRRAWNFRESGQGSGVFRSENGGASWSKVRGVPEGIAAGRADVSWPAANANVVYVAIDNQGDDEEWMWQDERVPSGRLTAQRFLRLSDATLPEVDERPLTDFIRSARIDKPQDVAKQVRERKLTYDQLKKMIEDRNPDFFRGQVIAQEFYKSTDGGKSFFRVSRGDDADYQYYFNGVEANPKNADEVIAMGFPLIRSADGGKTWQRIAQESHVDYHAVWFDPRTPGKVWIGNDGGLYVSGDHGFSVRHINNLSVGQPTAIAVDNKRPYNIFIGLQDNGTMKGPSNYVPGRSDPTLWESIGGGDGSHVSVDPRNDGDIVYIASQFGAHSGINQATRERWSARPQTPRGDAPARFNWVSPLIISAHHPDIIYVGAQRLYRSFNQGRRFLPISPDLTRNKPNGDVPFSTIKSVSESPLEFGLIYVGADDGRVTVTADGGATWQDIPTPQPDKWVSRVIASVHDVNTVYVAQNGYREDDLMAYLWRSTDKGKTWKSIASNLPMEPINVIIEDPAKKDTLYVGTDMGVFVSRDLGASWEPLSGMPNLPVHDLVIQARENELLAATHARGVYVLSLKPVHDYTAELEEKGLTIIDIPNVVRGGGGFRPSDWGYENRPRWDSTVPSSPTARVTLFTSAAGKATVRIKKGDTVLKEQAIDVRRGYNTLLVDLMLEGPKPIVPQKLDPVKTGSDALKDPYEAQRAKFLERGEYTVEVEVAGKKATSTFRITAPTPAGGGGG